MQDAKCEQNDLTTRTICGLLAQALFGVPYTSENDVDWYAVFKESRQQAVCAQVFANHHLIPEIPENLRSKIQVFLLKSAMNSARIHAQHTDLDRLMSSNGVSYTVLKGAASAAYYADPLSRSMGDVDFYIAEQDYTKVMDFLCSNGFTASHLDHECHVVLKKERVHMEMHRAPAGVPYGAVGDRVLAYLADLNEAAQLVHNDVVTCLCPSAFHHGLIMLMHLQHHMLAEGVGLRHVCDWAVFVNSFKGNAFPELFEQRLKDVGLWRLAQLLSLLCVQFLGMPEQPWMNATQKDKEIAADLMQDILSGGNFGNKDHQRAFEGMFISNRGKDGTHHNRFVEAFRALHRITYIKHPFFERCKILLPIGWSITLFGYLIRNIGRRKCGTQINTLDAYKKSAARQRLYHELKLYEPQK